MIRFHHFAGLALFLALTETDGVQLSNKSPILACHVPLELKIFADSSYQATSADLKSCNQITLSTVNALFLPNTNTSLASVVISEKRSLELLKQQTPEAEFAFSLRSSNTAPALKNLKTIFNGTASVVLLVEFLKVNKLKSFDIAWDLIQSAPDYMPQLKVLKAALSKEGFNLTTTIGIEVDRTNASHITNIASVVDRIFLVSSFNRHYSGGLDPLVARKPEQAFDTLELNEGVFLKLYSSLNLNLRKIVIGLSLKSLVWKVGVSSTAEIQLDQKAILQLQPYYESCKSFSTSWRLRNQPSPFYHLAVAPTNDQWMIHIDPVTLGRRVDLLRQYNFSGVALYDYYHDDFAGVCSPSGKVYPLIQQAGNSIRRTNLTAFPEIDPSKGLCIPFLGLTDCKGAFNFGTPKLNSSIDSTMAATQTTTPGTIFFSTATTGTTRALSTTSTLTTGTVGTVTITAPTTSATPSATTSFKLAENYTTSPIKILSTVQSTETHSSLSSIPVIAPLPAVTTEGSSTSTLSFHRPSPESTLTALSVDETTVVSITPAARMAADEHLVRTRRSSVSSNEFDGTQPSYSYLKPPVIDSNVPTLNFSLPSSKIEDVFIQQVSSASPSAITEALPLEILARAGGVLDQQFEQSTTAPSTVAPTMLLIKTRMPITAADPPLTTIAFSESSPSVKPETVTQPIFYVKSKTLSPSTITPAVTASSDESVPTTTQTSTTIAVNGDIMDGVTTVSSETTSLHQDLPVEGITFPSMPKETALDKEEGPTDKLTSSESATASSLSVPKSDTLFTEHLSFITNFESTESSVKTETSADADKSTLVFSVFEDQTSERSIQYDFSELQTTLEEQTLPELLSSSIHPQHRDLLSEQIVTTPAPEPSSLDILGFIGTTVFSSEISSSDPTWSTSQPYTKESTEFSTEPGIDPSPNPSVKPSADDSTDSVETSPENYRHLSTSTHPQPSDLLPEQIVSTPAPEPSSLDILGVIGTTVFSSEKSSSDPTWSISQPYTKESTEFSTEPGIDPSSNPSADDSTDSVETSPENSTELFIDDSDETTNKISTESITTNTDEPHFEDKTEQFTNPPAEDSSEISTESAEPSTESSTTQDSTEYSLRPSKETSTTPSASSSYGNFALDDSALDTDSPLDVNSTPTEISDGYLHDETTLIESFSSEPQALDIESSSMDPWTLNPPASDKNSLFMETEITDEYDGSFPTFELSTTESASTEQSISSTSTISEDSSNPAPFDTNTISVETELEDAHQSIMFIENFTEVDIPFFASESTEETTAGVLPSSPVDVVSEREDSSIFGIKIESTTILEALSITEEYSAPLSTEIITNDGSLTVTSIEETLSTTTDESISTQFTETIESDLGVDLLSSLMPPLEKEIIELNHPELSENVSPTRSVSSTEMGFSTPKDDSAEEIDALPQTVTESPAILTSIQPIETSTVEWENSAEQISTTQSNPSEPTTEEDSIDASDGPSGNSLIGEFLEEETTHYMTLDNNELFTFVQEEDDGTETTPAVLNVTSDQQFLFGSSQTITDVFALVSETATNTPSEVVSEISANYGAASGDMAFPFSGDSAFESESSTMTSVFATDDDLLSSLEDSSIEMSINSNEVESSENVSSFSSFQEVVWESGSPDYTGPVTHQPTSQESILNEDDFEFQLVTQTHSPVIYRETSITEANLILSTPFLLSSIPNAMNSRSTARLSTNDHLFSSKSTSIVPNSDPRPIWLINTPSSTVSSTTATFRPMASPSTWLVTERPNIVGNLARSTSSIAEVKQSTINPHTTPESPALFSYDIKSTASSPSADNIRQEIDFIAHVTQHQKDQENSKNCTDVVKVNLNNAHLGGHAVISSFNLTNGLGQPVSFLPQQDVALSPMCKAAGNSPLLKSLFCPHHVLSNANKMLFPNLMNHTKHLAAAIIANLTESMNLTDSESDEEISVYGHSNDSDSLFPLPTTFQSSLPEISKKSPVWIHTFHYENGSTAFVANFSFSPFTTQTSSEETVSETTIHMENSVPINFETFLANLNDQLKDKQLDHVISAVNLLNHTIPKDLLDRLLRNDSGLAELFNKSKGKENAELSIKETTPVPTTTTDVPTVGNVLHKNFWKIDRRHPMKGLRRIAGPRLQKIPSIGRRWRTMSPASSLFRPLPKIDDSSIFVEPISAQ